MPNWRRKSSPIRANVEVGEGFTYGQRCAIWAPRRLSIGRDVRLGSDVRVEVDGSIGDSVLIANGTAIVGKFDHRLAQVGTPITRSDWVGDHHDLSLPVQIGSDVWVGFGSIILSGVSIGDSAVIAAGSVVTTDVAANSLAAGVPARHIRDRFSGPDFDLHWSRLEQQGYRRLDQRT